MPKPLIVLIAVLVIAAMYVGAQIQMGMDDILYPSSYQDLATATPISGPSGAVNGGDIFVQVNNNCNGVGNNCSVTVVAAPDQSQDTIVSNVNSGNVCDTGQVLAGGVCVIGLDYQYGQGQDGGG